MVQEMGAATIISPSFDDEPAVCNVTLVPPLSCPVISETRTMLPPDVEEKTRGFEPDCLALVEPLPTTVSS